MEKIVLLCLIIGVIGVLAELAPTRGRKLNLPRELLTRQIRQRVKPISRDWAVVAKSGLMSNARTFGELSR